MPYSFDYYLCGGIELQVTSPSRFHRWRITREATTEGIIVSAEPLLLKLNLRPLSHIERSSIAAFCARTCEPGQLRLRLYNETIVVPNREEVPKLDPHNIFFPFPWPTAGICIFLDDNVPRTAISSITAAQSFVCCTLSKRLVERFAELDGINEWVVSGVDGSPTAYEKRRKKYVEVPSKTAIGDRAHFSFTIPEEYGGRNYPVRSSPDGYEAGEIQVTVRGKTMSLAFSPVEGNGAQQSVGPADANFDETHDALLVALAAGWLPNLPWFDPIQSSLMDGDIPLSVHVTLDASEFMVARMRAAYNLANRKNVEDDGIKRYGAVIDSNAARTDSRVAANFIDRVIEYVHAGPEKRFLLLRESE